MQHPGFLQDVNKIMAWLAFNDKNFTVNQHLYIIDALTFEVSVDGIVKLNESVGFIRVKFKNVQEFDAQNSSLISLIGSPQCVNRYVISNAKNLLSFEGITKNSNTLLILNCLSSKLPSYASIGKTTCNSLALFERGKVDLCGFNNVFIVLHNASVEYYDVIRGGLEILNMTYNNEYSFDVSVHLRTLTPNLCIIQKYLDKDKPIDYVMDCYMELIDRGYVEFAEM